MATAKVGRVKPRQRPGDRLILHGKEMTPPPAPPSPPGLPPAEDSETEEELKAKYKLEELEIKTTLGTGTFGRVVLTRDQVSHQYFALKVMTISEVIRLKQIEHVKSEKAILRAVRHPFIVHMLWADHNDRWLYMLLEYVCGGELFSYLRNAGRFNVKTSNFYACEIISALEYLHAREIVYRDLKPENLLLDRQGHLKLTDFGFAKYLTDRTWTLCGTPEYLAPEIIQNKGHNKAVDWWALGILLYEMLVGYPPFFDDNPFGIYEKILAGKIEWPKSIDPKAKDLIKKLLVADRTRRLGSMRNNQNFIEGGWVQTDTYVIGGEDVKRHRWFVEINWDDVFNKKLPPPIVPRVRHRGDTRNFYEYPELDANQPPIIPKVRSEGDTNNFEEYPEDGWKDAAPADPKHQALFVDF